MNWVVTKSGFCVVTVTFDHLEPHLTKPSQVILEISRSQECSRRHNASGHGCCWYSGIMLVDYYHVRNGSLQGHGKQGEGLQRLRNPSMYTWPHELASCVHNYRLDGRGECFLIEWFCSISAGLSSISVHSPLLSLHELLATAGQTNPDHFPKAAALKTDYSG